MELIADGLLIAGALAAAMYCWVLSQRVSELKNLDSGLGGAIAELSRQVDEIRDSLAEAKTTTDASVVEIAEKTARAEVAAGRLELLLASVHERADTDEKPDRKTRATRGQKAEKPAPDENVSDEEEPKEEVLHALRSIVQGMRG